MDNELLKLAATQGTWAALSIVLIFYILKAQEKRDIKKDEREKNYQFIISKLSDKLNLLDNIENEIRDIKELIKKQQ